MLLVLLLPSAFLCPSTMTAPSLRSGAVTMDITASAVETRAERLVRERLNPKEPVENMTEKQLRKYAYAMQSMRMQHARSNHGASNPEFFGTWE